MYVYFHLKYVLYAFDIHYHHKKIDNESKLLNVFVYYWAIKTVVSVLILINVIVIYIAIAITIYAIIIGSLIYYSSINEPISSINITCKFNIALFLLQL